MGDGRHRGSSHRAATAPVLPVVGGAALPASASPGQVATRIVRLGAGDDRSDDDVLAAEEPLEIRLAAGGAERVVAVTMRTPGHDGELAAGFLFAEGILRHRDEVRGLGERFGDAGRSDGRRAVAPPTAACDNRLWVELEAGELPDLAPLERHFFATSACGVCGKAGLESLSAAGRQPLPLAWSVDRQVLTALPERARAAQGLFSATGGLHAAALFTTGGELVEVREDVGRHNALDKLIGNAFLADRLPLDRSIVLVSGRSSFEILQKCLVAEVPVVCSVSAPSSLAVEVARRFGITLVGFLRDGRANVYSAPQRIAGLDTAPL